MSSGKWQQFCLSLNALRGEPKGQGGITLKDNVEHRLLHQKFSDRWNETP